MNKRIGWASKILQPNSGYCQKCHTTWGFVEEHTTWYTESKGIFALCEKCWSELKIPQNRLPYYAEVAIMRDGWELIVEAVLEGK